MAVSNRTTSTYGELEDQVHLRVIKWLNAVLPGETLIHHSPNEGKRHINFKTKLKRMGTQSGWPDLELFVPDSAFLPGVCPRPIFLELKRTKGGRLSESQVALSERFIGLGMHWHCCNSARAVRAALLPLVTIQEGEHSDSLLEDFKC